MAFRPVSIRFNDVSRSLMLIVSTCTKKIPNKANPRKASITSTLLFNITIRTIRKLIQYLLPSEEVKLIGVCDAFLVIGFFQV